jgi:hypothetical protein
MSAPRHCMPDMQFDIFFDGNDTNEYESSASNDALAGDWLHGMSTSFPVCRLARKSI